MTEEDKQWVKGQLDAVEGRFARQLEKVETSLLTAFHKWASPVESRVRSHSSVLRALDDQTESMLDDIKDLKARVEKLEQNRPNSPRQ